MTALKTNFLQEIASALKTMWKTCIKLSKKMESLDHRQNQIMEAQKETDVKLDEVVRQHIELINQIKSISLLQADMAKQIISQHEETDSILKGLGLKKDLSYYSFNLQNEEGH